MRIDHTIYLDHQATTPVDKRVLSAMAPYFAESFGNPHSVDHGIGWQAAQAVDEAAEQVACLIGADADEIIFTSGATEANNVALLGLGRRAIGGNRRRILLSAIEHKCVVAVGRALEEQYGFTVEQLPVDREGFVMIPALEEALDDNILAVSVMVVNNEIGTIQKIEEISRIARNHGAVFHCDAAQAPVAMNTATIAEHIDIGSFSSHKMYGPKGIGVVYVSRELQDSIEPLVYGGGQQKGLALGHSAGPALCRDGSGGRTARRQRW